MYGASKCKPLKVKGNIGQRYSPHLRLLAMGTLLKTLHVHIIVFTEFSNVPEVFCSKSHKPSSRAKLWALGRDVQYTAYQVRLTCKM